MNTHHSTHDAGIVRCLFHKQPHRWSIGFFFLLVISLACFVQIQPVAAVSGTDTITTVGGTGTAGYGGDGGSATAAQINGVRGVAFDSAGNLYLADTINNRVRRVDKTTGIMTTVAGTGTAGFSGDGGLATSATLNQPWSITFDSAGNLYIADNSNNRIRQVNKLTGVITTVAGSATQGFGGDGAAATNASLYWPAGITFDSVGNLYIADSGNSVIRKVDTSGIIMTVAGTGVSSGYNGDNQLATAAMLRGPQDVACDTTGNLYIADNVINPRIRKVDTAGNISTVVGTGMAGYSGDGNAATSAQIRMVSGITFDSAGNMYFTDRMNNAVRWVDMTTGIINTLSGNGTAGFSGDGGLASSALLDSPADLAFNSNGNLYITDLNNNRIRAIGPLPPTITAVTDQIIPMNRALTALPLTVGDLDTPVTSLTLSAASSNPALVPTGNIVFGGSGANRTLTITPATGQIGTALLTLTVSDGVLNTSTSFTLTVTDLQMITTVVGTGAASYSGDGGLATAAQIGEAYAVTTDSAGNLYLSDSPNQRIRRVDRATGGITTVAGNGTMGFSGDGGIATSAQFNWPRDIAFDGAGNLYIGDTMNYRVRRVDAVTGIITTVAGTGVKGYSGDGGAATSAQVVNLRGLACDSAGNLYIADYDNQRIRRVDAATGIITTVVGNGTAGYSGDRGLATAAQLNNPQSLIFDSANNLYFSDATNHVIRRVDAATGVITTVAGTGVGGYSGDAIPATSARLNTPRGVVLDGKGYLYIADGSNHRIRRVNIATGIIDTIVGTGVAGFSGNGSSATAAQISGPWGIALDNAGNLYIADGANVRIRRVIPPPYVAPTITSISNQTIPMNGALPPQPLTVGDLGNSATSLTLSAASSNPALVPVANIRFGGNGANRTVTIAPTVEMSGTAVITLTVSDGELSTSTSFTLTVQPALMIISTVAGTGISGYNGDGGPATAAQINVAYRMVTDSAGNLYINDSSNARVRRVDKATGIITTVAGNGTSGYSGDGNLAINAQISSPQGLAFDPAGNLYISDIYNYRIRRVDALTGMITTVAGTGTWGYNGDGIAATTADINGVQGIACDSAGNLYLADEGNSRIRRIDALTGIITTVAGTGLGGYSGDGSSATAAQMNSPQALAFDGAGNLYIADTYNYRIRRVDMATGIITTVAGTGTLGYSGDGGLAIAANIGTAYDVAVDTSGNIYIPDWSYNRIRRVDAATGIINTIVGTGTGGTSGDGGFASQAQVRSLSAVTLDAQRTLYFIQQYDYLIRRVTPTPNAPPTITPIANQTITMNGATTSLPVTIGDDLIAVANLTLRVTSSNLALVPVANIALGGSGANHTITITPTLWLSGTTTITLTVSDGQLSTNTSFTLTVSAVAPLITSAAPTAGMYGQTYSYSLTATGIPAPSFAVTAGSLPPGLTLTANGLLSGVPTTSGSFPVTFDATNGVQPAASASYTLVINPAPLRVTANNQSRLFGAGNPVLTFSATGFVLGDTVSVLSGALATTAVIDSPAGSYPITQGSLSATNYTLNYTPGTLTITATGTNPCAGSALRALLSSTAAVIDLDGTCRYQFTETTGGNGHLINLIAHNNQTINGNGAVIEGSGVLGLISLIDSTNVTIRHLTLHGGHTVGTSNTLAGRGGALLLYNSTVTLDGVQLINNQAALGGAIATVNGSTTVINSLFDANQSNEGGAAIFAQGPATVSYSTIADSSANPDTAILTWDSFSINRSIIANYAVAISAAGGANKPVSEEDNLFAQVGQRYRTYNVGTQISIGQRSLSADTAADQFVDVAIHNYEIKAGTLAVDRTAPPSGLAAVDLYGRPRPFGNSLADLGAYEFQGDHSVEALKLAPRWAAPNSPFTIELRVTNRGYAPVQGLEVHDTLPNGFSLVGSLTAGGSIQGNTLIWPINTIQPNQSISLTYQVTATAITLTNGYQILRAADQRIVASGPSVQVEISTALVAVLRSPSGRIFDPTSDGFGFAAWNNHTFAYPPAELMYRLFGPSVCAQGTEGSLSTCLLTATAYRQNQSLQRIIDSGRTFGMAAFSLKLFRGEALADGRQLPSDFQPGTTITAGLQRSLAVEQMIDLYQATRINAGSQAPLALASNGTASDVVRMLVDSGFAGTSGNDAYTLQVRQPGVGGTTLLPYALERRGTSSYWLYVYDPKAPSDVQRVVSLDSAANTWAYSGTDGSSYRGDSTNGSISLRRLSVDAALPRTCVFCAQPQAAGTLAQTNASIAFMLSGPGAMQISDVTGHVINVDAQGIVTVNHIPGAWVDQIDPGSGTNLPPVIYVPTGSPYTIVITSTNGTGTGVALSITTSGMIAELENLPLSAVGDSLSLSIDAATNTIRFSAGTATRSAQKLSMAIAAPDGKSYSFTTSGFALPSGATVNMAFDTTTNRLSLSDDASQSLRYDMVLMRVEPGGGTQTVQRNNLTSGLGTGTTINLDGWTGEGWPTTAIIPNHIFLPMISR